MGRLEVLGAGLALRDVCLWTSMVFYVGWSKNGLKYLVDAVKNGV
jgi:hypothetical protein